jgi:uncharacterized protein
LPVEAHGSPDSGRGELRIRVAAAGDVHCEPANREAIARAFRQVDGTVDAILLAGDLTTHGEPEEGVVLADACRSLATPVIAVLGNHDWHVDRRDELVAILEEAGIAVLDPGWRTVKVGDTDLGVVGAKGFVGGFPGSHLSDFGEPSLRSLYAEGAREVDALDEGLRGVALAPFRIVVLHYAPIAETLEGEPPGIWTFLGSDRLAAPLVEHTPDLVVHGHAHSGTFEGTLSGIPVYNVSVPVMGRDFWVFELTGAPRPSSTIH